MGNPGATTGTWRLEIAGEAAPWIAVYPTEVVVPAGGHAECRVEFRVPREVPTGINNLGFSLIARGVTAEESSAVDGVLELGGGGALSVTVDPRSSRATLAGSHRVVVDNRSASPARVVLTAQAPVEVDVELSPDSLVVEAQSAASARLVVRPRTRLLRGPVRRHRFTVRVEALSGDAASAAATMVQRPFTTGLLPRAVAVVAAVALAVVGLSRLVADGDSTSVSVAGGGPSSTIPVDTPAAPETPVAPTDAGLSAPTSTAVVPPPVDTVPAVPNDQRRIAFQTTRDGNSEIYAMNADGTGVVNLSNSPSHDSEPAWSPDGHRIAFDSDRGGSGFDVWVMNADGSGVTRLTSEPAADGYPAWSPDGSKIAFITLRDGNSEIYVMNADGTGQRRLTTSPADDARPTWAPDGNRIAFQTNRDGNFEVYSMSAADGSSLENLTQNPASDLNPAWSPDGTRIAFDSTRDAPNAELYVMAANGTAITRLTTDPAKDFWPAWSRDSSAIAFQSGRDGDQELYVLRLGRPAPARLTASPGLDGEPSW